MTRLEAVTDTFWMRHSNPKSGWSRMLVLPALLYAIYRREWLDGVEVVVRQRSRPQIRR